MAGGTSKKKEDGAWDFIEESSPFSGAEKKGGSDQSRADASLIALKFKTGPHQISRVNGKEAQRKRNNRHGVLKIRHIGGGTVNDGKQS